MKKIEETSKTVKKTGRHFKDHKKTGRDFKDYEKRQAETSKTMKKDRKRLQAPNFPIFQAEICLCDSDRCNNADPIPEVRCSKIVDTSRA